MDLSGDKNRILIFAPFGKDSQHLCKVLGEKGFQCFSCTSVEHLVSELSGHVGLGVGLIITTEEVLASKKAQLLTASLKAQPSWSAIPLLIFYTARDDRDAFQRKLADPIHEVSDTSFLERPVSAITLISAVRAALRDRQRQYVTRDLLVQLQQDIDQRAEMELELKQANDDLERAKTTAENANHSKSQFLANMSHEIRTPLGAIMGFADLIAQARVSGEELASFVSVIRRNSVQLLRIIDDILDLSKVEAGKMEIEDIEFSLPELFSDFTSFMGLRARETVFSFLQTKKEPFQNSSFLIRLA